MNLEDAIKGLPTDKTFSDVILKLIKDSENIKDAIKQVETKNKELEHKRSTCNSDSAYWSFLGEETIWKALESILIAADTLGPNNLPNVPVPYRDGALMTMIDDTSKYGNMFLQSAKTMERSRV